VDEFETFFVNNGIDDKAKIARELAEKGLPALHWLRKKRPADGAGPIPLRPTAKDERRFAFS